MQMLKPLTYELFFQNGSKICNSKIIRMYYMLNHRIRCMSSTVNHLFHILIHVNQNQSKSIKVSNRVTDFCRLISIKFLFLSTFKTIDMLCPVLRWMFTRAYSRKTREENSHYKPNPQNNGLIHLSSIPNKELSYHYRLLQMPENFNYKITKIVRAL